MLQYFWIVCVSAAKFVTGEYVHMCLEEHEALGQLRYFELSYAKSDWEIIKAVLATKAKLKRAKSADKSTQLCPGGAASVVAHTGMEG